MSVWPSIGQTSRARSTARLTTHPVARADLQGPTQTAARPSLAAVTTDASPAQRALEPSPCVTANVVPPDVDDRCQMTSVDTHYQGAPWIAREKDRM